MFLLLHLLFFYNLSTLIWKPCVSLYYGDTTVRMTGKIKMLSRELLIDAISKVDSIQHFRASLYKSKQFQYGNLVYQMRYRHKKMFKLYTQVLDEMENSPVLDGNDKVTEKDMNYLEKLAEVDSLAHEILNFATMIQMHDANLHADKSIAGYDLFFRRKIAAPLWLELVNSLDNNDNNDTPIPGGLGGPEENNLTHTGKRKNAVWHYAAPT